MRQHEGFCARSPFFIDRTQNLHSFGCGKLCSRKAADEVTTAYLASHFQYLQRWIQVGPIASQSFPSQTFASQHAMTLQEHTRHRLHLVWRGWDGITWQ